MLNTTCSYSARIKIELLTEAGKKLSKLPLGSSLGVCYTLSSLQLTDPNKRRCRVELIRYISHSLKGELYLSGWIKKYTSMPVNRLSLRTARLAWIDWMIASLRETAGLGK